MVEKSYRQILWILVLFGTTTDLVSKYGVFKWLYPGKNAVLSDSKPYGEFVVVPGAFRLLAQYSNEEIDPSSTLAFLQGYSSDLLPIVNHGALFGVGNKYQAYSNTIFAVISVVAALAIGFWSTRPSTARDRVLCMALGCILAGTLGNLYDRIVFGGVRDFLHFFWFEWPVFNFADCCLVCGAGLLLLQAFFARQPLDENKGGSNTQIAAAANSNV